MAEDWTTSEIDLIVADYFSMLIDEISGAPYSKAEHNRVLQQIIARSRGSIEFKHQNISAVMRGLGQPWMRATNLQSTFRMRSLTEF